MTRAQPITLHESDVEDSCGEEGSVNIPLGFSAASAIDLSPLISKKAHSPKHAYSPAHQRKGYLSVATPQKERRTHRSSKRESRTRAHEYDFSAKAGASSPAESVDFRRSSGRHGVECASPPDTPPPVQLHFGSEGTSSSNDNRMGDGHGIDEVTHLRRDVESLTARAKELQRENGILRRLLAAAEEKQDQPAKQTRSVGCQAEDDTKRQDLIPAPIRVGFSIPSTVQTARGALRSPTVPLHQTTEEYSSSMSLSPLPSRSDSSSEVKNTHVHRRHSTGYALMSSSPFSSSRLRESHVVRASPAAVATTGAATTKRITRDGVVITSGTVDGQPYSPKVGMTSYVTRSSADRSASAQPTLTGSPCPSPSPYATATYRVVRSSPEDVGVPRRSYGTVDTARTCFYY